MEKLPQRLVNVRVADRDAAMASDELAEAVARESAALEGRGRVLVRPSGTEPLVRVMVEAPTEDEADAACGRLVDVVRTHRADSPADGRIAPRMRRGVVARVEARPVGPQTAPALVHGGSRHPCAASLATSDGGRCASSCSRASQKLEYRGYDSAGISVLSGDAIESVRAVGNLANLRAAIAEQAELAVGAASPSPRGPRPPASATRAGPPTAASPRRNAHPHSDTADRVHVVVNGIVENYLTLKAPPHATRAPSSPRRPTPRSSPTWSRTTWRTATLVEAVRAAYAELEGHFAFVAMSARRPRRPRRRPQGVPAGHRPRRRRAVHRLRDPRLPRRDAPRPVHRERRDRRRAPRRRRRS